MIESVGVQYDEMTDDVEAQILRDFMILRGKWKDVWMHDPEGKVDPDLMLKIGVRKTIDAPSMIINYKVGPNFLPVPNNIEEVQRDLAPEDGSPKLDCEPHVGYYLRPQGRDNVNMNDVYLTRSYPRGNGVTDPMVVWLWS